MFINNTDKMKNNQIVHTKKTKKNVAKLIAIIAPHKAIQVALLRFWKNKLFLFLINIKKKDKEDPETKKNNYHQKIDRSLKKDKKNTSVVNRFPKK